MTIWFAAFLGELCVLCVEPKSDLRADARIGGVELQLIFLLGAPGVVAKELDAAGDVGPGGAERGKVFVKERLPRLRDAERVVAVERADAGRRGVEAVRLQYSHDGSEIAG